MLLLYDGLVSLYLWLGALIAVGYLIAAIKEGILEQISFYKGFKLSDFPGFRWLRWFKWFK